MRTGLGTRFLGAWRPVGEPRPSLKDLGRIFYDGHEAWAVIEKDGKPIWVRAPEKDANPLKDSKSSRRSDSFQAFHKPYP
jgi:hypothetical protein